MAQMLMVTRADGSMCCRRLRCHRLCRVYNDYYYQALRALGPYFLWADVDACPNGVDVLASAHVMMTSIRTHTHTHPRSEAVRRHRQPAN